MIQTELNNADLQAIVELLKAQDAVKYDAVADATAIRSEGGLFHIKGMGAPSNVEQALAGTGEGVFLPTVNMVNQVAAKLGVPQAYLRKCHEARTDLFDANVNGWLHGSPLISRDVTSGGSYQEAGPDPRKFLVRTFTDPDGGPGLARAFLSDSYGFIDIYDTLVTFLDAVREADPDAEFVVGGLSESRLRVRVSSPKIAMAAPILMANYRPAVEPRWNPGGINGERQVGDIVSASLLFTDSETGEGKYKLIPQVTCLSCTNGLTVTYDADRFAKVHLGAKLPGGIIQWSAETQQKNLALVQSMTKDAVAAFMNPDYLRSVVEGIEAKAGRVLDRPAEQVESVTKQLGLGEDTARLVLDHFIKGGQMTAGGVMNAVTSVAQVVSNDQGFDLENMAFAALEAAYVAA